jgi:hypothetical protein
MGLINAKLSAYRRGLSRDMAAAHWHQIPVWAEMIGHISGMEGDYPRSVAYGAMRARQVRPTMKPIEVLTDFGYIGTRLEFEVPIYYPFVEDPVYGDNPATGTEEDRKFAYRRCIVNQVRKAVNNWDGVIGQLALNERMIMSIMKNNQKDLIDYNNRLQAYSPYDALTRGHSQNILASKAAGGFGNVLSQRSHPNFFAAGYGQATWSDVAATYETNVGTALDSLGNSATDYMSSKVITNAKIFAANLRITPTKVGQWDNIHVMIIHQAQWAQLQQDETFMKAAIALTQKEGTGTSIFTGVSSAYIYGGMLILVDNNAPGVWTSGDTDYSSTRGTVNYGNAQPIKNPLMTSDRKLAFIVGASAVMCGHIVPLGFKSQTWDYENKKSEASHTVIGYNRADIYDQDGFFGTAGNFKENVSSLIIATYSPNTPAW